MCRLKPYFSDQEDIGCEQNDVVDFQIFGV